MSTATQTLRHRAANLSTALLVEALSQIEDTLRVSRDEPTKITYAVLAAEATRRMGLTPAEVLASWVPVSAQLELSRA